MGDERDDDSQLTLYVGNLDRRVTEELLYELFLQAAPLKKIIRPRDPSGRLRNYAFVVVKHKDSVEYTINLLNGINLFGRSLTIRVKQDPQQSRQQELYQAQMDAFAGGMVPSGLLPGQFHGGHAGGMPHGNYSSATHGHQGSMSGPSAALPGNIPSVLPPPPTERYNGSGRSDPAYEQPYDYRGSRGSRYDHRRDRYDSYEGGDSRQYMQESSYYHPLHSQSRGYRR